jgi:hypothetical protein
LSLVVELVGMAIIPLAAAVVALVDSLLVQDFLLPPALLIQLLSELVPLLKQMATFSRLKAAGLLLVLLLQAPAAVAEIIITMQILLKIAHRKAGLVVAELGRLIQKVLELLDREIMAVHMVMMKVVAAAALALSVATAYLE